MKTRGWDSSRVIAHAVGRQVASASTWLCCGYWSAYAHHAADEPKLWLVVCWQSRGGELTYIVRAAVPELATHSMIDAWESLVRARWESVVRAVERMVEA